MPQVINNLDLKKNEIQNVVLQPLSTPPTNPKIGQKYFNINDKNEYRWNGTAWVTYQSPLSTTTASTISIPNGIVKGDGSTLTAATAGTDYQAPLPSQTGNSGKYLTTNGSVLSWANPPGAPVTSVNTKTGDVVLTATDVGAATSSDISTAINALDGSITGTAGAGKTLTAFSQTNGKVIATFGDISITKSQVSDFPTIPGGSSTSPKMDGTATTGTETAWAHGDHVHPSDTNKQNKITASGILKGNGNGTITAATAGTDYQAPLTAGTDYATPSQIPNVPSWAMAATKPTYTATEVGAIPTSAKGAANGVAPLNASSQIDPSYLPSYVDDVIEGYYNSTDGKFYEEDTYTTEITPEAGKIYIDLSTNKSYRWGGSTYVEMPTGSTVTVSPTLTSGEEVGTITIDGTTTTLYAPEDTDTKVTQTKATASSYTYWRPVPVGALSASAATTAFSTAATTDRVYSFDNFRFQPSTGTLRVNNITAHSAQGTMDTVRGIVKAHSYYVDTSSSSTTNRMESDSSYNIYFRVNGGTDTVMTLYSNGTDMQVRPGGQYDDKVDLGKSTVRWKDLYLSGDINLSNTSAINFGSFGPNISSASQVQLDLTSYVEADDGQGGITIVSHPVKITGVDTPVASDDAVNKAYVDSAISGISFLTNCEVTVTHIVGTWNVNTTYATMVAAHNAGGIVYFTYGSFTAIASFNTSNMVTANIMYMDSEGVHQIQITVNSFDEVDCTETNYTFPTIYNGETS